MVTPQITSAYPTGDFCMAHTGVSGGHLLPGGDEGHAIPSAARYPGPTLSMDSIAERAANTLALWSIDSSVHAIGDLSKCCTDRKQDHLLARAKLRFRILQDALKEAVGAVAGAALAASIFVSPALAFEFPGLPSKQPAENTGTLPEG